MPASGVGGGHTAHSPYLGQTHTSTVKPAMQPHLGHHGPIWGFLDIWDLAAASRTAGEIRINLDISASSADHLAGLRRWFVAHAKCTIQT
jgi:hypothetical protein